MEGIDVREFLKQKEQMEIEDARRKEPYRISAGQALLDNEELNKKWEILYMIQLMVLDMEFY